MSNILNHQMQKKKQKTTTYVCNKGQISELKDNKTSHYQHLAVLYRNMSHNIIIPF